MEAGTATPTEVARPEVVLHGLKTEPRGWLAWSIISASRLRSSAFSRCLASRSRSACANFWRRPAESVSSLTAVSRGRGWCNNAR